MGEAEKKGIQAEEKQEKKRKSQSTEKKRNEKGQTVTPYPLSCSSSNS